MKPIPSTSSREAQELLNKAQRLLEKAEQLEMVEHEGKKVPHFAADGKGDNDAKKKGNESNTLPFSAGTPRTSKRGKMQEIATDRPGMRETGEFPLSDDETQKAEKCPHCDGDAPRSECICGKTEKGSKKCPECGGAINKIGMCKAGCMKMQKSAEMGSQPNFITTFNSEPQNIMFAAESGGQTRNAYYSTNQHLYTGTDVTNKGATSESVNIESLSPQMNPHDGDGVPRQVLDGNLTKAQEAVAKAKDAVAKAVCRQCGGNQFTGCRFGFGDDCPGLEGTMEAGERIDEDRYDPSEYMRTRY